MEGEIKSFKRSHKNRIRKSHKKRNLCGANIRQQPKISKKNENFITVKDNKEQQRVREVKR